MPDATTLTTGVAFVFNNMATGTLTIQDYAAGAVGTISAGGAGAVFLTDNSTTGGTWDLHAYLPEGVTFGTNAFNLGTSVISGGTWQGGTIQPGYGGTGLTTFVGANNALYSTGATTLTAGTLPVAAGGTGVTSLTSNNVILGNGTSAVQFVAPGSNGNVLTSNGTTWTSAAAPGATISNDTSTASTLYPTFVASTSGALSTINTSNAKLLYTPSSGEFKSSVVVASNGILVNGTTVSANYTIATGTNGQSIGPITVAAGVTVTVSSGQRWLIV
jgi:hypothetical protein